VCYLKIRLYEELRLIFRGLLGPLTGDRPWETLRLTFRGQLGLLSVVKALGNSFIFRE
jgi:hypothetical protein